MIDFCQHTYNVRHCAILERYFIFIHSLLKYTLLSLQELLDCYGRVALHSCTAQFHPKGDINNSVQLWTVRNDVSKSIAAYYSLLNYSYAEREKEAEKQRKKKEELTVQAEKLKEKYFKCIDEDNPLEKEVSKRYKAVYEEISKLDSSIQETEALNRLDVKKT